VRRERKRERRFVRRLVAATVVFLSITMNIRREALGKYYARHK